MNPGAGRADTPSPNTGSGHTPSTASIPVCATCSRPQNDHPYRHPFNNGELSGIASLGVMTNANGDQVDAPTEDDVEVVEMAWPFDPVLRQALVDKGIITADDLRDAERKIKDMSAIFNGRL